jgi:FAD-dependent urate hydroxylase
MRLDALIEQVKTDLDYLNFRGTDWVRPLSHPEGHV